MKVEYIRLMDTIDLADRRVPVLTLEGSAPGPTLWLTASCHGDEVTGIEVIHRIMEWLQAGNLRRGTVHAMPVMNPIGSELVFHRVPLDGENLNRWYPGDPDGSFTERTAYSIYTRIVETHPDLVIDIHTMHTDLSLPFIILDRFTDEDDPQHPQIVARLEETASAFGVTIVYDFEMDVYRKFHLDQSLTGALLNHAHILSYTVELGPPRIVMESFVKAGVQGVLNSLAFLDMINRPENPWRDPRRIHTGQPLRRDYEIRVNSTGIMKYLVAAGNHVHAGQPVAQVRNLIGLPVETVRAPRTGYVLYLGNRVVVVPGTEIMALAIPDE
jgi:predicted deacylase